MSANQAKLQETEAIEWSIVEGENTEFSAQYPRLQWVHGSKQAAGFMKVGGLFISKEQYPNFTGEGFEPTTLITRKGDEIEGYAATSAKLAVIRIKHQWVKEDTGRNVPMAHVLCVVKGSDDLLCISLRGASKALEFQKAFNQHIGQNVAVANRTRPNGAPAIEPFALWFPVKACEQITITSKNGKDESAVTPPIMDAPEKVDRDYVTTLWVGADNYKAFAGLFRETSAWQKQPIWEQRHDDADDTPAFSGGDDRATQAQIEHIAGICEAKGMDIADLCMTATDGATDNLAGLTKREASEIIETAKAY